MEPEKKSDSRSRKCTYLVAKCLNKQGLLAAHETEEWACCDRRTEPQPKALLEDCYKEGDVCLLFSVNNCHGWHGFAFLRSAPSSEPCKLQHIGDETTAGDLTAKSWFKFKISWGTFLLKLHQEKCLSHEKTSAFMCADGVTPLNQARNFQQIDKNVGQEICCLLDQEYQLIVESMKTKELEKEARRPAPCFHFPEKSSSKSLSHEQVWEIMLEQVEHQGKVHLACAFGSQRYNCNTPDSDLDMFVIFQANTADVLGFNPPQHTMKNREGEAYDYTVMELHRFCDLLLSGDPRCVETLFLHPSSVYQQSAEWQQLVDLRQHFLTKQVCEKYLHDALGAKGLRLLEKWEKSDKVKAGAVMAPSVGKLFYIIIRLLQNAQQVMDRDFLQVYRENNSIERHLLMCARSCEYPHEKLRTIVDRMAGDMKSRLDNHPWKRFNSSDSKVPVQRWLLRLRYDNLHSYMKMSDMSECKES